MLGTLAGDDTIFLAVKGREAQRRLVRQLQGLVRPE
jgi:arginine repressor